VQARFAKDPAQASQPGKLQKLYDKLSAPGAPLPNATDRTIAAAVAIDANFVTAAIGEPLADGLHDGTNANIRADGRITVLANSSSRPNLSAVAQSTNSSVEGQQQTVANSGFGGGVIVGYYDNATSAAIYTGAQVNAKQALTVEANTLNQIDPSS